MPYLNRLADLAWVLARFAESVEAAEATPAVAGGRRAATGLRLRVAFTSFVRAPEWRRRRSAAVHGFAAALLTPCSSRARPDRAADRAFELTRAIVAGDRSHDRANGQRIRRGLLAHSCALALARVSVTAATPEPIVTLITAGDIGRCDSRADERTARLAEAIEGTVLVLGDNAYDGGSPERVRGVLRAVWGHLLDRTLGGARQSRPSDTGMRRATSSTSASRAGPAGRGWYCADGLATWPSDHARFRVPIRSAAAARAREQFRWLDGGARSIDARAMHGRGLPQATFLVRRPRRLQRTSSPLWRLAVESGADIVLNGHEHSYERLGPMDAGGRTDREGATVFIVGTAGAPLRGFESPEATSQVRIDDRHGVLVLELADGGFDWAVPLDARRSVVEDEGSGTCH